MFGLAVIATYDAEGRLWPHVRHQVETYAEDYRVVLVSAGGLAPADRAWAEQRAQVVERENTGYDFASYKAGLEAAGDLAAYDQVVLSNDSFVGPVVPLSQVQAEMARRGVDFWGLTASRERQEHLQSYLVGFTPRAVGSPAFAKFWRDFEPICDREKVIERYELGLTSTLADAGLSYGAYFEPTAAEQHLTRARRSWLAIHLIEKPENTKGWNHVRNVGNAHGNPCIGLADRVFDAARLPVVKIETLRDDPYCLGADTLLELGEESYPAAFAGVREFLAATRKDRGRDYGGQSGMTPRRAAEAIDLRYGRPRPGAVFGGLRRTARYPDDATDPNTPTTQVADLVGGGLEVLEVGCGSGALGAVLTANGCRVTGLEADADLAAYARKKLADVEVGEATPVVLADRFAVAGFDVVVLADILEHVADPAGVLEAARRLLRPNGRVVVSTPNAAHGSRRLALLQGRWSATTLPLDRRPLQTYTRESLLELLADARLLATELRGTLADPLEAETGVPQATLPFGLVEWVRNQDDALVEAFQLVARPMAPGERAAESLELRPAVAPEDVRLADIHTERHEQLATQRRAHRQLPRVRARVDELEARVAELEAELAQSPTHLVRRAAGKVRRRLND